MNQFFFLQASSQGAYGNIQLLMLVGIIAVFYFFMIRPQAKKAKEAKKFQQGLQKGDKIVTIAGIHGTINKVNEDSTIEVQVSPGSYIRMEKSAISMEWTRQHNPASAAVATTDKK